MKVKIIENCISPLGYIMHACLLFSGPGTDVRPQNMPTWPNIGISDRGLIPGSNVSLICKIIGLEDGSSRSVPITCNTLFIVNKTDILENNWQQNSEDGRHRSSGSGRRKPNESICSLTNPDLTEVDSGRYRCCLLNMSASYPCDRDGIMPIVITVGDLDDILEPITTTGIL